jgi:hypothetical protein
VRLVLSRSEMTPAAARWARAVVFLGPPGAGVTTLTTALHHEAALPLCLDGSAIGAGTRGDACVTLLRAALGAPPVAVAVVLNASQRLSYEERGAIGAALAALGCPPSRVLFVLTKADKVRDEAARAVLRRQAAELAGDGARTPDGAPAAEARVFFSALPPGCGGAVDPALVAHLRAVGASTGT